MMSSPSSIIEEDEPYTDYSAIESSIQSTTINDIKPITQPKYRPIYNRTRSTSTGYIDLNLDEIDHNNNNLTAAKTNNPADNNNNNNNPTTTTTNTNNPDSLNNPLSSINEDSSYNQLISKGLNSEETLQSFAAIFGNFFFYNRAVKEKVNTALLQPDQSLIKKRAPISRMLLVQKQREEAALKQAEDIDLLLQTDYVQSIFNDDPSSNNNNNPNPIDQTQRLEQSHAIFTAVKFFNSVRKKVNIQAQQYRRALRKHNNLIDYLSKFWLQFKLNKYNCINKTQFMEYHLLINKALCKVHDDNQAHSLAILDWTRLSMVINNKEGNNNNNNSTSNNNSINNNNNNPNNSSNHDGSNNEVMMEKNQFLNHIFETIDSICITIDVEDYISLAHYLYLHITRPTVRKLGQEQKRNWQSLLLLNSFSVQTINNHKKNKKSKKNKPIEIPIINTNNIDPNNPSPNNNVIPPITIIPNNEIDPNAIVFEPSFYLFRDRVSNLLERKKVLVLKWALVSEFITNGMQLQQQANNNTDNHATEPNETEAEPEIREIPVYNPNPSPSPTNINNNETSTNSGEDKDLTIDSNNNTNDDPMDKSPMDSPTFKKLSNEEFGAEKEKEKDPLPNNSSNNSNNNLIPIEKFPSNRFSRTNSIRSIDSDNHSTTSSTAQTKKILLAPASTSKGFQLWQKLKSFVLPTHYNTYTQESTFYYDLANAIKKYLLTKAMQGKLLGQREQAEKQKLAAINAEKQKKKLEEKQKKLNAKMKHTEQKSNEEENKENYSENNNNKPEDNKDNTNTAVDNTSTNTTTTTANNEFESSTKKNNEGESDESINSSSEDENENDDNDEDEIHRLKEAQLTIQAAIAAATRDQEQMRIVALEAGVELNDNCILSRSEDGAIIVSENINGNHTVTGVITFEREKQNEDNSNNDSNNNNNNHRKVSFSENNNNNNDNDDNNVGGESEKAHKSKKLHSKSSSKVNSTRVSPKSSKPNSRQHSPRNSHLQTGDHNKHSTPAHNNNNSNNSTIDPKSENAPTYFASRSSTVIAATRNSVVISSSSESSNNHNNPRVLLVLVALLIILLILISLLFCGVANILIVFPVNAANC